MSVLLLRRGARYRAIAEPAESVPVGSEGITDCDFLEADHSASVHDLRFSIIVFGLADCAAVKGGFEVDQFLAFGGLVGGSAHGNAAWEGGGCGDDRDHGQFANHNVPFRQ